MCPCDVTFCDLGWNVLFKESNLFRVQEISYSKCKIIADTFIHHSNIAFSAVCNVNTGKFLHGCISELLLFKWLHWSAGSAARVCSWAVITSLSILSPYSLPAVTVCVKLAFQDDFWILFLHIIIAPTFIQRK